MTDLEKIFWNYLDPNADGWKLVKGAPPNVVAAFERYLQENEEDEANGFITN